HGAETLDEAAKRRGQPLVRGLGVGEHGVTAGGRDHQRVQDRPEGRRLDEGDVGMPLLAHPVLLRPSLEELAGLRVVDLEHLPVLIDAGDDGVGVGELTEGLGERLVLGRVEMRLGKEDDLVVEERLANLGTRRFAERRVQVDVANLGADGAGEGCDRNRASDGVNAHGGLLWIRSVILTKSINIVKKGPSGRPLASKHRRNPARRAHRAAVTPSTQACGEPRGWTPAGTPLTRATHDPVGSGRASGLDGVTDASTRAPAGQAQPRPNECWHSKLGTLKVGTGQGSNPPTQSDCPWDCLLEREVVMARDLGFPVFDADNHMYETRDALTKYLPAAHKNAIDFVDVHGRTKIVVRGQISDYIPNPTFDRVGRPGAQEEYFKLGNPDGKSYREIIGRGIDCPPAFREARARLELMEEQGIDYAMMDPTLASLVEER